MKNDLPLVSIIIPCRNEGRFILRCLDSVISQDYPKEKIEVLVVDGMSEDETRKIVEGYVKQYSFIKLLENHKKIASVALNIGIRYSKSNFIIIMGAHTSYEKEYISKCIEYLNKYNANNVGGVLKTVPGDNTFVAQAIAITLSHSFGVGNSYFRINSKEPKLVDTVFGGCYKREIFEKIGLFNEKLVRNQDIEFNSRLRKRGGKIFLIPKIKSYYRAPETLRKLWQQNFQNGLWGIYTQKLVPGSLQPRHFVPFCFVIGLMCGVIFGLFSFVGRVLFILIFGSYILLNLFFSLKISFKKGIKYFPFLPIAFFVLHFSYGLGSIWGIFNIWKKI